MKIDTLPIQDVVEESNPESAVLAYKIAVAIQTKLKNGLVGLRTLRFEKSGRYLFEYTLSDEKNTTGTAFSEGYFENTSKEHVSWLANKICSDLVARSKWLRN